MYTVCHILPVSRSVAVDEIEQHFLLWFYLYRVLFLFYLRCLALKKVVLLCYTVLCIITVLIEKIYKKIYKFINV